MWCPVLSTASFHTGASGPNAPQHAALVRASPCLESTSCVHYLLHFLRLRHASKCRTINVEFVLCPSCCSTSVPSQGDPDRNCQQGSTVPHTHEAKTSVCLQRMLQVGSRRVAAFQPGGTGSKFFRTCLE